MIRRGPVAAPREGSRMPVRSRLLASKQLQCELVTGTGELGKAFAQQLELALGTPITPASSFRPRVSVCSECERWGYHLVGCSRRLG